MYSWATARGVSSVLCGILRKPSPFDLKRLIMTRLGCECLTSKHALPSQLLCTLFLTWNVNPAKCEILTLPKTNFDKYEQTRETGRQTWLELFNMWPKWHVHRCRLFLNSCFGCCQHGSCAGSFFVLTFIDTISVQRNLLHAIMSLLLEDGAKAIQGPPQGKCIHKAKQSQRRALKQMAILLGWQAFLKEIFLHRYWLRYCITWTTSTGSN